VFFCCEIWDLKIWPSINGELIESLFQGSNRDGSRGQVLAVMSELIGIQIVKSSGLSSRVIIIILIAPVIFHQSECYVRGRTHCIRKTKASVQALISGAKQRMRACSQATHFMLLT